MFEERCRDTFSRGYVSRIVPRMILWISTGSSWTSLGSNEGEGRGEDGEEEKFELR